MSTIGQQRLDTFGLALVALLLAGLTALSLFVPVLSPWCFLALGILALLSYWVVRWEITVLAWLWVLSYGIVDTGLWKWEIPGFFNLSIPRLVYGGAILAFVMYFLVGRGRPRFDRGLLWVMLALIAYCAVSATATGWTARTEEVETAPYYRFTVALLFPFIMVTLIYSVTRSERQIRWGLILLSLYGWYALYISYLQYAAIVGLSGARAWIFPAYINDPTYGIHFDRARGAFRAAGPQSLFLVFLFYAVLFLIRRTSGAYRIALIAQAILIPPAIFFTGIRAAYVSFALCGVLWCLAAGHRRFGGVKLGLASLVLILVAAMFWGNITGTNRQTGGVAQEGPIVSRQILLYQTWEIFKDHPITGVGFGHFVDAQQNLRRDPASLIGLSVGVVVQHNLFLNMLAETGVLGLIGILLVLWLLFSQSLQLYRKLPRFSAGMLCRDFVILFWVAGLNYLAAAMFRDTFWDVFANALLWSLAGLVIGYNRLLEDGTPEAQLTAADRRT